MRVPAMLFVYAGNGESLDRAMDLVREDQRFGFVRYKNPKFWPTSGIAELLTVPGAKFNPKSEKWSFDQAKPDVWVLHGSRHADAIVSEYQAAGVSAQIVGAPVSKPKPAKKKRAAKKKAAKKASKASAEE